MDIVYPDKYYSKIKEKFPELSDAQIEKIVLYGVRSIFMMSHYNVDIKAQQGKFFMYIGQIFTNSNLYYKYRKLKLAAKHRILSMREKKPYNGKYYFILTEDRYSGMKNKKKGKTIPYNDLMIFKLQSEAELELGSYLYEVDYPEDIGFRKRLPKTDLNYRLIAKRNPKDVWGNFIPVSTDSAKEKTMKRRGGK